MCRFYPKWASLSHPLPVACVADFLVFFELVTHHLKELVAVGTQVLHEAHQILDGLLYYHRALEAETGERIVTERKTDTVKDMEKFERTGFYAKAWSDPVCCSANMTGCLQLHMSICHRRLDWWLVLESLSGVVTLYWWNGWSVVCKWISAGAHICVCFWTSVLCVFSGWKWVCVHLSQCAHHQEPRQGCDSSHYRLATPAWLIAGPGTAEQLHIPRRTHTYTRRGNFSKRTPSSNSRAVKWDYNSVCSRLPAPST